MASGKKKAFRGRRPERKTDTARYYVYGFRASYIRPSCRSPLTIPRLWPCARWPRLSMTCRDTCWRRRSAPCSTSCLTCGAKCCSPRSGTPARASARRLRSREGDFLLRQQYPLVQLATLKQRGDKAEHRAGRRAAGVRPQRLVPLSDAQYVTQLEMMITTLRILIERRSENTGRTERVRLWDIADHTAHTWLNVAAEAAASEGVSFSVPVTLHTF